MDKTLKEVQQEIIEDFSMYDEWFDKYAYLIDLGKLRIQDHLESHIKYRATRNLKIHIIYC